MRGANRMSKMRVNKDLASPSLYTYCVTQYAGIKKERTSSRVVPYCIAYISVSKNWKSTKAARKRYTAG
jgi:hypothetical protein